MTPEQLEIAITHYLDGTLPAEEVGALKERLASDPVAQALLGEHERLTAMLRSQPLPEADWADLAKDLSAVITGNVDERSRIEDQKLNAILKGATPLPEIRWDELSRRISGSVDAEIEGASDDDQAFDGMLRSAPKPAVNWDRLAGQISQAIAAEAPAVVPQVIERPAVAGRIGFGRRAAQWAVAASVLVSAGLGLTIFLKSNPSGTTGKPGNPELPQVATAITIIDTPKVEVAAQPAIAEISIGPSKSYASADDEYYRRGGSSRSQVVIATPVGLEDDGEHAFGFD